MHHSTVLPQNIGAGSNLAERAAMIRALLGVFAAMTMTGCFLGRAECSNNVVLQDGGVYSYFANESGCSGSGTYDCTAELADAGPTQQWKNACDCDLDGGLCRSAGR